MKARQLSMWKMTKREAGRAGYLVATGKMGAHYFHSAGGQATARMDLHSCNCHGVGVQAYAAHYPLKGKKHRYG